VAGDGPQGSAVDRLDDADRARVRMLGRVPHAELPAVAAACDLYLGPATGGESFGVVLVEAMAAGLPVVASDIPGYDEVVRGGVVLAVLWAVFAFNRLVTYRSRAEEGWSQIDVQLRRRYDLIPNLVETVKGYAAHERELFEEVARARSAAIGATGAAAQASAENAITSGLRKLLAVAENYPDLKASANFLALQEELTGTESKIAYAR